jgi:hypothetical protein
MVKLDLYNIQNSLFNIVIIISYLLYFTIALGLSANAPHYLETLQHWVKLYIGVFLIYRFNIFQNVTFTELDRKVAFSAGLFLFSTTIFNQILISNLDEIKNFFKVITNNNININI